MANFLINQKADKTETYKGTVQIESGADTYQYKFVQTFEVEFNDTNVQRDRVDDSAPVFTRIGDVIGTFQFNLKNTVDLYDSVVPATNTRTVSYWAEKIASADFPSIIFIETFQAPASSGNKFARVKFTGRMMNVRIIRADNVAIPDVEITGEITALTHLKREAA